MDTKHFIYFIIPTLFARETNKSLLKKNTQTPLQYFSQSHFIQHKISLTQLTFVITPVIR